MKRTYLIVFLFSIIMVLVPFTSAFEIPLSDEDKVDLKILIKNDNTNNQKKLNNIFLNNDTTNNSALDLDEIERIYENYLLTGDDSVINSDPWDWLIKRLGWIYPTIEHVETLYYTGIALYYEILEGSQAVQGFLNSIQAFRISWQAFKANPSNFLKIINLTSSTINLLVATIDLLNYAMSNALKETILAFADQVQNFRDFLESNPWLKPIKIKGNVTGFDESITISVKSDSVTASGNYELDYITNDTIMPWFVHKCVINATYQDKNDIKNRYAFSMGIIEEDYTPSDFDEKSKKIENLVFLKLSLFLKQLLQKRQNILDNIIKIWNINRLLDE